MANYNIYRLTYVRNSIEYKIHFHFGGKSGDNLGIIDLPPDVLLKIEVDFSMPENRLTGLELAKNVKISLDTEYLYELYGATFIDNLYNGSEVTGTDRNINIPIDEFASYVVSFDYPNRLYITENTGLGDNKIFDGVQKFEFSNYEYDDKGILDIEFICIGSYILQNILIDQKYLRTSYDELTYYTDGTPAQTMDGNTYATTTSQTHVMYDFYYNTNGTTTRVEMKDEDRPDIVFGSTQFKELIDDINNCAEIFYDALTRAEISPQFIMPNINSDNILHNVNLYAFSIQGNTSSSFAQIISYYARIITAIFDFTDNNGSLEIYKSDDLFVNFEYKNAYDFINNLLENFVSKASFTYGDGYCKLNWHYAKQSRFSNTSGDSNLSYSVNRDDFLTEKIERYFKASSGTNILVPLLMNTGEDYENKQKEDKTFEYPRLKRYQAPTDEINLQFHNLPMIPSRHRRNREVKNGYKPAWTTLPNYNAIYNNIILSTDDGNYYALLRLSDFCRLKLSNTETITSIDTAELLPIQNAGDQKKSGSIYSKRMLNWITNQNKNAGLHYVVGNAYNDLYNENQKIVIKTQSITLKDFGKTITLSNADFLVSGYLFNKIKSEFVITGIRSLMDGFYEITLVSI